MKSYELFNDSPLLMRKKTNIGSKCVQQMRYFYLFHFTKNLNTLKIEPKQTIASF